MAYYWTCPNCGSNNDPGEACDCRFEETKKEVAPVRRERPQAQTPNASLSMSGRKVKASRRCLYVL